MRFVFNLDFDFDFDFDLKRKRFRVLKKMLNTIVGKRFERKFGSDLAGKVGLFSGNEPPLGKIFNDRLRQTVDGSIKDDDFYKELFSLIDGKAFSSSNAGSTPATSVWELRVSITPKNIAAIMNKDLPVVLGISGNENWNLAGFTPESKKVVLTNPLNNKRKTVILKEGKFILGVEFEREPRHSEMGA